MKLFLYSLFNKTIGKFLRLAQRSLLEDKSKPDLHSVVYELSIRDTASYVYSTLTQAMAFKSRLELWAYSLQQSSLSNVHQDSILILEFGVWKGESINYFASSFPQAEIYGFDSFQGLEEDWYGHDLPKGAFDLGGVLPIVKDNVTLIQGWFEDTLPKFKEQIGNSKVALLHLDADTYKPTKYVLESLRANISSGTIVIFDEYFGYPNWRQHEFKAWQEFVLVQNIKYRYIAYSSMQCAIEII
jgi:hypothetical protein